MTRGSLLHDRYVFCRDHRRGRERRHKACGSAPPVGAVAACLDGHAARGEHPAKHGQHGVGGEHRAVGDGHLDRRGERPHTVLGQPGCAGRERLEHEVVGRDAGRQRGERDPGVRSIENLPHRRVKSVEEVIQRQAHSGKQGRLVWQEHHPVDDWQRRRVGQEHRPVDDRQPRACELERVCALLLGVAQRNHRGLLQPPPGEHGDHVARNDVHHRLGARAVHEDQVVCGGGRIAAGLESQLHEGVRGGRVQRVADEEDVAAAQLEGRQHALHGVADRQVADRADRQVAHDNRALRAEACWRTRRRRPLQ